MSGTSATTLRRKVLLIGGLLFLVAAVGIGVAEYASADRVPVWTYDAAMAHTKYDEALQQKNTECLEYKAHSPSLYQLRCTEPPMSFEDSYGPHGAMAVASFTQTGESVEIDWTQLLFFIGIAGVFCAGFGRLFIGATSFVMSE